MKNVYCIPKLLLLGIVAIIISVVIVGSYNVYADYDSDISVVMDGQAIEFDNPPVIVNSRTLVPVRAVFEAYGAKVSWDADDYIITAILNDTEITLQIDNNEMIVNQRKIELDTAPLIINDRTMVPVRAISESFGSTVTWDEENRIVVIRSNIEDNPTMNSTEITNDYRYENYDGVYNGVSIFDNDKRDYFGMELLDIKPREGEAYANIINGMAADLSGVRVFCGVAPTAAEFYAPESFATNYLASISHIYNNLSDSVTPFNIEAAMMENADKYIYFRTDHHWTHLGSYYAYRKFCEVSGNTAPDITEFDTKTIKDYAGSWSKVTVDTDGYEMLNNSKDNIEAYMPNVEYEGNSYSDMDFNISVKKMQLINLAFGSYSMFLEGDYPLEVYHTNVDNGKSICVIKESYGNAFSTWLLNNYETVYIVDYRVFNGNSDNDNEFNIKDFYNINNFDDLLVLSYPYTIIADDLRQMLGQTWRRDYSIEKYENDDFEIASPTPMPSKSPGDIENGDLD